MSGWGQLDILVTSRSVAVALGSLCGRTSRSVANSPGMSTRMEGRKEGRKEEKEEKWASIIKHRRRPRLAT